jgi:myb proto-oncogene protein
VFSPEEDQQLLGLIEELGTKRWSLLAHHMQTRTAKQCRERWHCYLNPAVNKGPWTAEEDRILAEKHRELSNRWTEIAKFLPGRTNCLAKNRWNALLRAQQSQIAAPVKQPLTWQPLSEMDFKTLPPLIIRGTTTSPPNHPL